MAPRNITTVIFDCDNTLVQSEPIGFEVSAEITNEILESRGIHNIRFTGPQLQREFVGMTFQAMVGGLILFASFPSLIYYLEYLPCSHGLKGLDKRAKTW